MNSPLEPHDREKRLDNFGIAGKSLVPHIENSGHAFDAVSAARVIEPLPAKPTIAEDSALLHRDDSQIPHLRTYESDMAAVVKQKHPSVISVAVAEQKKAPPQPKIIPAKIIPEIRQEKKREPLGNAVIIVISVFLILCGLGAIGLLAYYKFTTKTTSPQEISEPTEAPIITVDSKISLITPPGESPSRTIALQKPQLAGPRGSLIQIQFLNGTSAAKPINAQDFTSRFSAEIPSWLSSSFNSNFVFGYQILDTPQPFLVLKTNSFDNAFSGMLKWEPVLPIDFNMFDVNSAQTSSTTLENNLNYSSSSFQDAVISNKDVRLLNDFAGQPVLIYALADKQTIVITTNPTTLKEIFSRLSQSSFVQ